MLNKLIDLPINFWVRLGLLFLAYIVASLGSKFLHVGFVDPSLIFSGLFIGISIAFFVMLKVAGNSFFTYLVAQLMMVWIVIDSLTSSLLHFSVKPHAIAFAFMTFAAVVYLFKNFKKLWEFPLFKFIFVFFLINILYYFCYYSTFNIADISTIYKWSNFTENQSARVIVFLDSVAVFTSSIIAISALININTQQALDKLLFRLIVIFNIAFSVLLVLCPLFGDVKGAGYQVYFSIYFVLIMGLKYYLDNNYKISEKYNSLLLVVLIGFFGLTILSSNKSSLIALFLTVFIFMFINHKLQINFRNFAVLKNKRYGLWFWFFVIVIVLFLAAKFNVIEIITNRLSSTFGSVHGISSLYIRKANWKYFLQYWSAHSDLFNTLFGFGLGKSREIIFYTSAMMYSPIYMVQTTHNQYMEMFFDYGFMALFYYIPLVLIAINNIGNLISKQVCKNIKLLSNVSLAILMFYVAYHMTDGLRVPTAVIFFSSIVFIEALKKKMISFKDSNTNKD